MSRIHFHNSNFFDDFLKNRYETIQNEIRPSYDLIPFTLTEAPIFLSDMLINENSCLNQFNSNFLDISRLEPENPYVIHTHVPSARSLQSNLVMLSIDITGKRLWFVYLKSEQQFVFIHEEAESVGAGNNKCTYYILYNHLTIGRYYGHFGFLLSLLDVGHQIHHFEHLVTAYGFTQYEAEFFPALNETYIDENYYPLVQMCFQLEENLLFKKIELLDRIVWDKTPYDDGMGDRSYQELIKNISVDSQCYTRNQLMMNYRLDHYLQLMSKRTSLQSFEGLCFFEKKQISISNLIEKIRKKTAMDYVDTLILEVTTGDYYLASDGSRWPIAFDDLEQILHDSKDYIDINSSSYLILTVIREHKELTYKQKLLGFIHSAEIMSEVALIFSEHDFVTRCLRNINDKYVLEQFAGFDEVTYLQVVGENVLNSKLYL